MSAEAAVAAAAAGSRGGRGGEEGEELAAALSSSKEASGASYLRICSVNVRVRKGEREMEVRWRKRRGRGGRAARKKRERENKTNAPSRRRPAPRRRRWPPRRAREPEVAQNPRQRLPPPSRDEHVHRRDVAVRDPRSESVSSSLERIARVVMERGEAGGGAGCDRHSLRPGERVRPVSLSPSLQGLGDGLAPFDAFQHRRSDDPSPRRRRRLASSPSSPSSSPPASSAALDADPQEPDQVRVRLPAPQGPHFGLELGLALQRARLEELDGDGDDSGGGGERRGATARGGRGGRGSAAAVVDPTAEEVAGEHLAEPALADAAAPREPGSHREELVRGEGAEEVLVLLLLLLLREGGRRCRKGGGGGRGQGGIIARRRRCLGASPSPPPPPPWPRLVEAAAVDRSHISSF